MITTFIYMLDVNYSFSITYAFKMETASSKITNLQLQWQNLQ